MNELTTFRWTFEQDVSAYVQAGFNSIGVWRQKLDECGEEKSVDLLCESGLGVSSLSWAGGFTGSDGRCYNSSVDDAIEAVRLAAAIRAECLVVYTGGRGGHTHRHANRLALNALVELLPVAEDLDVAIAVEPMHAACGQNWTFLNCLDATQQLLSDFPALGMVFDTYFWGRIPDILERLPDLVSHISLVQLGDGRGTLDEEQNRLPVGDGELPIRELVQSLLNHGYDGCFEFELIGPEIETQPYEQLLAQSMDALRGIVGVEH